MSIIVERSGKLRVAFVVQRAGTEVIGGAESLCLQVAQRMSKYSSAEVLTTCALDYMTWDNHFPAGVELIGDTEVRRFPVDAPREVDEFNRLSADILERGPDASLEEQERWMRAQGPLSTSLLEYLTTSRAEYDAFIFSGNLYATTYFGLLLVKEAAYLAPPAHDEWPIFVVLTWTSFFRLTFTINPRTASPRSGKLCRLFSFATMISDNIFSLDHKARNRINSVGPVGYTGVYPRVSSSNAVRGPSRRRNRELVAGCFKVMG